MNLILMYFIKMDRYITKSSFYLSSSSQNCVAQDEMALKGLKLLALISHPLKTNF